MLTMTCHGTFMGRNRLSFMGTRRSTQFRVTIYLLVITVACAALACHGDLEQDNELSSPYTGSWAEDGAVKIISFPAQWSLGVTGGAVRRCWQSALVAAALQPGGDGACRAACDLRRHPQRYLAAQNVRQLQAVQAEVRVPDDLIFDGCQGPAGGAGGVAGCGVRRHGGGGDRRLGAARRC